MLFIMRCMICVEQISVFIVLYKGMVIFNDLDTIYEWMDMIDFGKYIETIKNYEWFQFAPDIFGT